MRDILFRGVDIATNKWVYGYYYQRDSLLILERGHYILDKQSGYEYRVIPESVGECTLYSDNNKRGIFEGDFVTANISLTNSTEVCLIVYKDGSPCLLQKNGFLLECHQVEIEFENPVVIGNLYDNPGIWNGGLQT